MPVLVELLRKLLSEEDDVRLNQAIALLIDTAGHLALEDVLLHLVVRKWRLALDAPLGGEAAVSLDNQLTGDASLSLEAVDVLGEEHSEEVLLGKQRDEGMRDGGRIVARIQLFRKNVEGVGVLTEIGDIEDGLGVWEIEASKIGIQAGVWGAEIRN